MAVVYFLQTMGVGAGVAGVAEIYFTGEPGSLRSRYQNENDTTVYVSQSTRLNLFNIASGFSAPVGGKILTPIEITFDSNTIWNNSIEIGGEFASLTLYNNGVIAGRGGDGNGDGIQYNTGHKSGANNLGGAANRQGNPAFYIDYDCDELYIRNESTGFIAGGGSGSLSNLSGNFSYSNPPGNSNVQAEAAASSWGGGGGGWNGGRGGQARASTGGGINSGGANYAYAKDSGGSQYRFVNVTNSGGNSSLVTSRSSNGSTGGAGSGSPYNRLAVRGTLNNSYNNAYNNGGSRGNGGSGLNGGNGASCGGTAKSFASAGNNAATAAIGCAVFGGGGGGSGIGSGNSIYDSNGFGSGAGAGRGSYSVQVSGATFGTVEFTNLGRIYGQSQITVT